MVDASDLPPAEEEQLDAGRRLLSPPDPALVYTPLLLRIAGAALDVIFLHIILIPLRLPATDLSFQSGHIGPAAIFTVVYFGFLFLLLWRRGLTPGGIVLGYRVVDARMKWPGAWSALRRLLPYALIALMGLWRLHVVIKGFEATGEAYRLDHVKAYLQTHGGLLNPLVVALNFFVAIDIAHVRASERNQAWTDILAGSFVVSKPSS